VTYDVLRLKCLGLSSVQLFIYELRLLLPDLSKLKMGGAMVLGDTDDDRG